MLVIIEILQWSDGSIVCVSPTAVGGGSFVTSTLWSSVYTIRTVNILYYVVLDDKRGYPDAKYIIDILVCRPHSLPDMTTA